MDYESFANILIHGQPKKVIISLLHSVILVREEKDMDSPISIVCMDGLSAKKIYEPCPSRGYGIEITHRDEIYQPKKFYLES
jgi:hypothetical protein